MPISSQYGITYVRNDANLIQPFWNNANGTSWSKKSTTKSFQNKRLSLLIFKKPICIPVNRNYPFAPVSGYIEGNDYYLTLGGTNNQFNNTELVSAVEKLNKLVGQPNYYTTGHYGVRTSNHSRGTPTPHVADAGYMTPSDKTPDQLLNQAVGGNGFFHLRTANQYEYIFTENPEYMYKLNGLLACL